MRFIDPPITPVYLTLGEIAVKWDLPQGVKEVERRVLMGMLRPSIYLRTAARPAAINADGCVQVLGEHTQQIAGWFYLQQLVQTSPIDGSFGMLSTLKDPKPGAEMWALETPITLADLYEKGAVWWSDLKEAEAVIEAEHEQAQSERFKEWHRRGAETKREASRRKVLALALVTTFAYNPRALRNQVHSDLMDKARAYEVQISENTLIQVCRDSVEEELPEYVAELERRTKLAGLPMRLCAAEVEDAQELGQPQGAVA